MSVIRCFRRSLSVAFQELQALMNMAGDMVKLAERFRGVMAQVNFLLLLFIIVSKYLTAR